MAGAVETAAELRKQAKDARARAKRGREAGLFAAAREAEERARRLEKQAADLEAPPKPTPEPAREPARRDAQIAEAGESLFLAEDGRTRRIGEDKKANKESKEEAARRLKGEKGGTGGAAAQGRGASGANAKQRNGSDPLRHFIEADDSMPETRRAVQEKRKKEEKRESPGRGEGSNLHYYGDSDDYSDEEEEGEGSGSATSKGSGKQGREKEKEKEKEKGGPLGWLFGGGGSKGDAKPAGSPGSRLAQKGKQNGAGEKDKRPEKPSRAPPKPKKTKEEEEADILNELKAIGWSEGPASGTPAAVSGGKPSTAGPGAARPAGSASGVPASAELAGPTRQGGGAFSVEEAPVNVFEIEEDGGAATGGPMSEDQMRRLILGHKLEAKRHKAAGDVAEALAALRKAKMLERDLETGAYLLHAHGDEDDEEASILRQLGVRSMDELEREAARESSQTTNARAPPKGARGGAHARGGMGGRGSSAPELGQDLSLDAILAAVNRIGEQEDGEGEEGGGYGDSDEEMDPEIAEGLAELGWGGSPEAKRGEGERGGEGNAGEAEAEDPAVLLRRAGSLKRKAVLLKREGQLGEALRALKQAKELESAAAAAPAAAAGAPPPGQAPTGGARGPSGRAAGAPGARGGPLGEVDIQKLLTGVGDSDEEVEVNEEDEEDPEILAALRGAGWEEEEGEEGRGKEKRREGEERAGTGGGPLVQGQGQGQVSTVGQAQGVATGAPAETQDPAELEARIAAHRRAAVEAKRGGDTAAALKELRAAKQLEAALQAALVPASAPGGRQDPIGAPVRAQPGAPSPSAAAGAAAAAASGAAGAKAGGAGSGASRAGTGAPRADSGHAAAMSVFGNDPQLARLLALGEDEGEDEEEGEEGEEGEEEEEEDPEMAAALRAAGWEPEPKGGATSGAPQARIPSGDALGKEEREREREGTYASGAPPVALKAHRTHAGGPPRTPPDAVGSDSGSSDTLGADRDSGVANYASAAVDIAAVGEILGTGRSREELEAGAAARRRAAVEAKRVGDTSAALQHLRVAKQMELELQRLKEGSSQGGASGVPAPIKSNPGPQEGPREGASGAPTPGSQGPTTGVPVGVTEVEAGGGFPRGPPEAGDRRVGPVTRKDEGEGEEGGRGQGEEEDMDMEGTDEEEDDPEMAAALAAAGWGAPAPPREPSGAPPASSSTPGVARVTGEASQGRGVSGAVETGGSGRQQYASGIPTTGGGDPCVASGRSNSGGSKPPAGAGGALSGAPAAGTDSTSQPLAAAVGIPEADPAALRAEALECKRQAVRLKAEGQLGEALAYLKRAKALEAQEASAPAQAGPGLPQAQGAYAEAQGGGGSGAAAVYSSVASTAGVTEQSVRVPQQGHSVTELSAGASGRSEKAGPQDSSSELENRSSSASASSTSSANASASASASRQSDSVAVDSRTNSTTGQSAPALSSEAEPQESVLDLKRKALAAKKAGDMVGAMKLLKEAKALELQQQQPQQHEQAQAPQDQSSQPQPQPQPQQRQQQQPPPKAQQARSKASAPPAIPSFLLNMGDDEDDVFDDALMANLKSLGVLGPTPAPSRPKAPAPASSPSPAKPKPAPPAPSAGPALGVPGATGLEDRIKELKLEAVRCKRRGDTQGALDALKAAKRLEADLALP